MTVVEVVTELRLAVVVVLVLVEVEVTQWRPRKPCEPQGEGAALALPELCVSATLAVRPASATKLRKAGIDFRKRPAPIEGFAVKALPCASDLLCGVRRGRGEAVPWPGDLRQNAAEQLVIVRSRLHEQIRRNGIF